MALLLRHVSAGIYLCGAARKGYIMWVIHTLKLDERLLTYFKHQFINT